MIVCPRCKASHPDNIKYCVCGYNFEVPEQKDFEEIWEQLFRKGMKNEENSKVRH